MRWVEEAQSLGDGAAVRRGFELTHAARIVPGMAFRPSNTTAALPTVLMGHGGSGHKGNDRMLMLGELFAERFGWCAISIDGPVHGDRGPVTDPLQPEYSAMWRDGSPVDQMIGDWCAVVDAIVGNGLADQTRLGYWGLSMGTLFGIPYVASDTRIKVAVLGKAGFTGTSADRAGIGPHFERYAPLVMQPTMFTMQWDDERFERAGQLDLYDKLGSTDKRLQAYPGIHVDNGPDAFDTQAAFLARYL